MFDDRWYLQTYADVASAKVDPALHFVESGWREGRDPGPEFSTSAYLRANPDVEKAGINPLVHYIEFGKFEGREVPAGGKRNRPAFTPTQSFDPAAPVFQGAIFDPGTRPWRRSYRLPSAGGNIIAVAELPIGFATCPTSRDRTEAAFAHLRQLSGLAPVDLEGRRRGSPPADHDYSLIDAWHAGGGMLRTRWQSPAYPVIVRAYQHNAIEDGRLSLVAESLAESALDITDVHLNEPYFPVLFVFADLQNAVRSTTLLAFPSLCRGGLHYAELVVSAAQKSGAWPDPVQAGLERASSLEQVKRDNSGQIRHIAVEPGDSHCSGPLFQPDFQKWLQEVAGVGIGPVSADGEGLKTLSAFASPAESRLRLDGGTLILANDMVPTIGVLTAIAADAGCEARQAVFAPLLVASSDPSQPALLVDIPADSPSSIAAAAAGYASAWPRTTAPAGGLAAAIRFTGGLKLSDAELLAPTTAVPAAAPDSRRQEICWLICPADWRRGDLVEALTALSLQSVAGKSRIAFVGIVYDDMLELAKRLFGRRVRSFDDLPEAVRELKTDLVGHLGPGVVLHDSQAAGHLIELLRDEKVSSVSCVLLTAEKKGKVSHVSVVDAGTIPNAPPAAGQVTPRQLIRHFWRAGYPVMRPPRDLWVARLSEARAWIVDGEPLRKDGIHLCSTMVSASYARPRPATRVDAAPPPPAVAASSVRARSFFG